MLWIRASCLSDVLWSAEQVLRNGSCGALLLWQGAMRAEALRRLQMAAQASDMLCWVLRPLAMADAPSPAPLRLALRPHPEGLRVDVLKRRGPSCTAPLLLQWPRLSSRRESGNALNAFMDRRLAAAVAAAGAAPALV
jgi:protein ImuA